eukprot:CAMPEP_0196138702 /NCGR_PEP_ID=MMETSP0910-20130528/6246_1 /TAXON_ID=49265 /ORGANISM="Thalassiosira rotula, Strain GSO102" /LENGTH=130 /DNA_ID=CAMNT_0041399333 /DNA_START=220 /DNA_END=608 /DNA_ORIENTATION=+
MFKKFDPNEDVSTSTQVKASVQRNIKSQITAAHPFFAEPNNTTVLDELLPKKPPLVQYKCGPHLMLYCKQSEGSSSSAGDEPVFFQHRDGPILPTLKFVHKHPKVEFTRVRVDAGAIPYLLGGANIMCPG